MMELVFLGTGAGKPSIRRNVTSMALSLVAHGQGVWLFDCGEGTQHQILRSKVNPSKIEKVFITHLHGDHVFGLPGLLTSRAMSENAQPLSVYGPPGIRAFVDTVIRLTRSFLTYPLSVVEVAPGVVFEDAAFTVKAQALSHRVECFGFRIEQADQPGALDMDRLRLMNISSGPVLKRIKEGETVVLDDGRQIDGRAYVKPPRAGKVVTILGDTAPCTQVLDLAAGADVLVHEATLDASLAQKANSRGHSTTLQAAEMARDAHVKRLIVTHISARYDEKGDAQLLRECQSVFPNTEIAKDFGVYFIG